MLLFINILMTILTVAIVAAVIAAVVMTLCEIYITIKTYASKIFKSRV